MPDRSILPEVGWVSGMLALLVWVAKFVFGLVMRQPEAAKVAAEARKIDAETRGVDLDGGQHLVNMASELAKLQQAQVATLAGEVERLRRDCAEEKADLGRQLLSLQSQVSTLREAWEAAVRRYPELRNTHAVESPAVPA
jgi:chemotaxis protein histidine kinase CheA